MPQVPDGDPVKKYVICPGRVVSKTDGQEHYVTGQQLARLYQLAPHEYHVVHRGVSGDTIRQWEEQGLMFLWPRFDGKYGRPDRKTPHR